MKNNKLLVTKRNFNQVKYMENYFQMDLMIKGAILFAIATYIILRLGGWSFVTEKNVSSF